MKDADTRDNRQTEAKEQKKAEDEIKKIENMKISEIKVQALLAKCETDGVNPARICALYKVSSLADLTEKKFRNINDNWKRIVEE